MSDQPMSKIRVLHVTNRLELGGTGEDPSDFLPISRQVAI